MFKNLKLSHYLIFALVILLIVFQTIAIVILCSPVATSTAGLTPDQMSAITKLLYSFGADETTVAKVQDALNGNASKSLGYPAVTITSVKLSTNPWLGGTGNTILVSGSGMSNKPDLNISVCHPAPTAVPCLSLSYNKTDLASYYCYGNDSCVVKTSEIGSNLYANNQQVFDSVPQTSLKVCATGTNPSCASVNFSYTPAPATASSITMVAPESLFWTGGTTQTLTISGFNFSGQTLDIRICHPTTPGLCLATPFTYTNNTCQSNFATHLTTCTLTTSVIGSYLSTNNLKYFSDDKITSMLRVCPTATSPLTACFARNFTYTPVGGIVPPVVIPPITPTDSSVSPTFNMPTGGGCLTGECVCVVGVKKICASPMQDGTSCLAGNPNFVGTSCANSK
ncbi:MAG: hypothetical protein NTY81_01355 [Candidatus Staskawiczbacteria bacterium]|nr:hypothetical protein [Candidatus Staskawiczbacteria bacterium]